MWILYEAHDRFLEIVVVMHDLRFFEVEKLKKYTLSDDFRTNFRNHFSFWIFLGEIFRASNPIDVEHIVDA